MKSAVALLVFVAFAASSAKSQTGGIDFDKKCHEMVQKFTNLVHEKAETNIDTVHKANSSFLEKLNMFVAAEQEKVHETVQQALKGLKLFEEVDVKCYRNATRDILLAEQQALINFASCKNLTAAYHDIDTIADQAEVVIVDVLADARVIVEGVAECSPQIGIKKWECVISYVAKEVKNIIAQWPDVRNFVNTVKTLGVDAEKQIEFCLNDPTQVSLDKKVKKALDEFDSCYQKSKQH